MRSWKFFGLLLLGNWVQAQCGYSSDGCAGITPGFLIGPPSPQCSKALPLTVTLSSTASGEGISGIAYYVRPNSGGPWNSISNPGSNQHTFTTAGVYQILQIVTGPAGAEIVLSSVIPLAGPVHLPSSSILPVHNVNAIYLSRSTSIIPPPQTPDKVMPGTSMAPLSLRPPTRPTR